MLELFIASSLVMCFNFYVAFAPRFRPMPWLIFNINIAFAILNLMAAVYELARLIQ